MPTTEEYFKNNPTVRKGSSILNSIFGLPTEEDMAAQKELMDYKKQIDLEFADYNSPANQMKRLREAGLNPDLAIGSSVQNTAQQGTYTPSVPHGHSSVPGMISSITQSALASSQIEKNQADAERARADAGKTGVESQFLRDTFGLRVDTLSESLGLKQDERKLLQTQVDTFSAYAEQALAQVSYLRELAMTERWRTQSEFHHARSAGSSANIMHQRDLLFPQFAKLDLAKTLSEIGVNDATKANIQQETRWLMSSFEQRLNLLDWQVFGAQQKGFLDRDLQQYYNTYDRFLEQQIQYYPFQVIGNIVKDPKFYKTDKEGRFVTDENGMPLINQPYKAIKVGLDVTGEVIGTVKDGAMAYGAIRYGAAMPMNRGQAFMQAPTAQSNFNPKGKGSSSKVKVERDATGNESKMFSQWYDECKTQADFDRVFQRISDYKKKHNIR